MTGQGRNQNQGHVQGREDRDDQQPPQDRSRLHLAVALDGAGWHPAAWRADGARPAELFTAGYWADLVAEAERGLLDLVTLEDTLAVQSSRFTGPDDRTDQVRGRLDAVLIAGRIAPLTSRIGLVPTTNITHTEPFHLSTALATLDFTSLGRAGWRPQLSSRADDAAHFGRRTTEQLTEDDLRDPALIAERLRPLFDEAADVVEVVRRLWDSWEDDAEIRDAGTGRFVDRTRLHAIDFDGEHFSVRGPSITPRPPQGQPPVAVLAHAAIPYELAAKGADLVFVTPHSRSGTTAVLGEVEAAKAAIGRPTDRPLKVFADLLVLLDEQPGAAARRRERLDELDGAPLGSDAEIFTGTPAELADLLLDRHAAGLDGFRLRPAELPHDLTAITRGLVPELQRRGAFRTAYTADTLRGHLGLPRPTGRYASARSAG
ncbi:LLM class flavin-dependent oxidoreductase [Kitasatospora sp. RG8]|uniref:LLM class flavin-dependent oxidoreductase n=1 Tax=Kitasatospora sp. RG8 TaxID=2820815 RepID=UPI001AE09F6D|nr:LLM class flavin-dependent oxidoreductase [Kitasatospora sp. RG8]MBP0454607.1 LLM class flavin-dependent oxidoreductase [Kitasatospora sp. RG8]